MSFEPITAVFDFGKTILNKFITDKDEALKAEVAFAKMLQEGEFKAQEVAIQEATLAANNVKAEIQGESPAQRNWRPHFMYVMMANISIITIYNSLIYPFVHIWVPTFPELVAPPQFWHVIELGLTGYVVSRGAEKLGKTIMDKWPKK